jgi:hypothetical protein
MPGRLLAILLVAAMPVAIATAGEVDTAATEGGGSELSGGTGDLVSFGLTQLLFEQNNDLDTADLVRAVEGPVDSFHGLAAHNRKQPVGFLVTGPNGTRFTYDRLATKNVLQLIGYGGDPLTDEQDRGQLPPPLRMHPTPFGGHPTVRSSSSIPPSLSAPPPVTGVVPEPAGLTVLLLTGLVAGARPRRRRPAP